MRKKNVIRSLGATILVAPLLMACDTEGAGGGGKTGDGTIPVCEPGQALSTSGSKIVCKDLPDGTIVLPACDATTEALTSNGQGLACTTRSTGAQDDAKVVERINKADSTINDLGTQIKGIGGGGTPVVRVYQGATTDAQNGNILKAGDDNSLVSAAKLCAAQYGAGARMCTVQDIYHSVLQGKISTANQITAKLWIYAARGLNPIAGSQTPNLGLGDNCASYTYPTGDRAWSGTAITTGNLVTSKWGINFHTGSEAPCSASYKIACCK